ncbi:OmpA domain protein [hydrothermal vent metagenome]|uniref:OmpA domain protein n=1 Tax=hydrothermal vent metagenome TaxID=652676 RepID=A0A3B0SAD3_9ZZZZ
MRLCLIIMLAIAALPRATMALELNLPGTSSLSGEVVRDPDSYNLPIGPYADGKLPVRQVEGRVVQRAWRVETQEMTTLQVIRPIREQLEKAGFEILFECAGLDCGGFDFRFNTKVMPAPNMFVDLFDFRYLAGEMKRGQMKDREFISVIVSRAGGVGYVQMIYVTPEGGPASETALPPPDVPGPDVDQPLAQALQARGHVILRDLEFNTGSASLSEGRFAMLEALAGYLLADKSRRVALVGHTDAVGALEDNIALSKRRAASVLERLVAEYGVPRTQLEAEGMGYLAPIAPNLTEAGREKNRRVEAVLLNTE